MWFHDHAKFVSAGRELLVAVANHQFQEWLELTFGDAVRSAATALCKSSRKSAKRSKSPSVRDNATLFAVATVIKLVSHAIKASSLVG